MVGDPQVTAYGDSLVAVWPGSMIACEFTRFTEHRDSLSAELNVTNGQEASLHWSRVNVASASGRTSVVRALEEREPGQPWRQMLDRACQLVARKLREAEPSVVLAGQRAPGAKWFVKPWMPRDQITILYGPGGSAKSFLALLVAISGLIGHPMGGYWDVPPLKRVLYLDWETTSAVQDDRIWSLTRAYTAPPEGSFRYKRLRRALTDVISDVRVECARHEVDFIVLDSLVPASGLEPEGADDLKRGLAHRRRLPRLVIVA